VPLGRFATLTPGGKVSTSSEAKAVLVQRGPVQIAEEAIAASTRTKTASGEGSAALTPEGAVVEYAKVAAAPIEWFAASDDAEVVPVEEIAESVIGRMAATLAGSALLCA
jgi:hypothetical protein